MKIEGHIGCLIVAMLLLIGCEREETASRVEMPISICLPANEVHSAAHAPALRKIGDPGTTESFLFPHYLYVVIVKNEGGDSWSVWQTIERTLEDEDWEPTHYFGMLPTSLDSIYQYKEHINLVLKNGEHFTGRVYAIASAKPLTFNRTFNTLTNLDQILNLTFDTSSDDIQQTLQHIYSTPYNLEINDEYFGSFNSTYQKVPYVNLLLYHVAAKVDITWHVAENKRTDPATLVRLTQMDALELFNGNAYCFRPMRNELAAIQADGYDREDIVKSDDVGLWWEGRTYFYTIPYIVTGTTVDGKNYFPLQMKMETNGSGTYYTPTLNLKIDTSAVFVPWLRANFNINAALSAGSPTLTVDE